LKKGILVKTCFAFILALSIIVFSQAFALAIDNGSWAAKPSISSARCYFGGAEANGKFYVVGGTGPSSVYYATVQEYDPSTNTWTTKADMPTARHQHGVVSLNGKIYAIGGQAYSGGPFLDTVDEYDPITNTWTSKANMPSARVNFGVTAVNNKIYVIGGYNSTNNWLGDVVEFDPVTNAWSTKSSMNYPRNYVGAAAFNGKIYVFGGWSSSGCSNIVEEYDPINDTWTTKISMPFSRQMIEAVTVNGRIYLIGGRDPDVVALNETVEYNPITSSFITRSGMIEPREWFAATAVNNKIYVAGGGNNTSVLSSVEEFTPPVIIPSAPTGLTATAGNAAVDLSWSTVQNATSYQVKRATTEGGPYTTIASEITESTYTDTGLTNGTTYYYVVTAVNSAGESANSNEASATPQEPAPGVPTNLTAAAGDAQVVLSWDAVTGAAGYNVKRATTAGGPYTIIASDVTELTYTDTGLTNGTTYYYVVSALNAGGESTDSNEASATPERTGANWAILVLTMTNGSEKEYDLPMGEITSFLNWYNARSDGAGNTYYALNKNFIKGPFVIRKEYVSFDKIYSFEIMEYNR